MYPQFGVPSVDAEATMHGLPLSRALFTKVRISSVSFIILDSPQYQVGNQSRLPATVPPTAARLNINMNERRT